MFCRRNAALAFFSCLSSDELKPFVCLMLRGVLPPSAHTTNFEPSFLPTVTKGRSKLSMSLWQDRILLQIPNIIDSSVFSVVLLERQIGFLHLLGQAVKILGLRLTPYASIIFKIVLMILEHSNSLREEKIRDRRERLKDNEMTENAAEVDPVEGDVEDEQEVDSIADVEQSKDFLSSGRVRSLCLLRVVGDAISAFSMCIMLRSLSLTDFVDVFNEAMDFSEHGISLFQPLSGLVQHLPSSIATANKSPPVLLRILHTMTQYPRTTALVADREDIVKVLINCVAASKMSVDCVSLVMESVSSLLEFQSGRFLLPHIKVISSCTSI